MGPGRGRLGERERLTDPACLHLLRLCSQLRFGSDTAARAQVLARTENLALGYAMASSHPAVNTRPHARSVLVLVAMAVGGCTPQPVDWSAEREEIEALVDSLPVAWNRRDAPAWVGGFAESSGFTNILGMHFDDRAANEARHAELFATIFSESSLTARTIDIRPVGQDAAVVETSFELIGYSQLPPGIEATSEGLLRTRLISVVEKRNGRWTIVEAQNTAVSPLAVPRPAN